MRDLISKYSQEAVHRAYFHTPLQRVARATGANAVLNRAYATFQSAIAPPAVPVSIGPASAEVELVRGTSTNHIHQNLTNERALFDDLIESVQPDDVVYDVGAYIGMYSVLAGDALTTGEVHAFEPLSQYHTVLKRNFGRNGTPGSTHRVGLSDSDTPPDWLAGQPDPATVMPMDEYLSTASLPSPTVVKIDVEGAEKAVLEGALETLSATECRLVYTELHPVDLIESGLTEGDIAVVRELLREFGFDVTVLASKTKRTSPTETVEQEFLKAQRA